MSRVNYQKSDHADPSPIRYAINYNFPRGVAKKRLTLSTFLSDQQKILINCILKYFQQFTACKKSNSKQPLSEFQSWQETLTWFLLRDVRVLDAVVAVQVQVQVVAAGTGTADTDVGQSTEKTTTNQNTSKKGK